MSEVVDQFDFVEPGTLKDRVIAQTQHALSCGALRSIPTTIEAIEQAGVQFLVRVVSNLVRKAADTQRPKPPNFNPFLPYEADLFVADLSETHLCLLNKFNVADHHLLVITREFEEQETVLNLRDFEALWQCMTEMGGLGFYNSGKAAGASQPHKHLQLIPFPIAPTAIEVPIAVLFEAAVWRDGVGTVPNLPFVHGLMPIDSTTPNVPTAMVQAYQTLLAAVGRQPQPGSDIPSGAYNLLLTDSWMLMVPRLQECYGSIPVNSLGFAGTLFVRNHEQLQQLKAIGPLVVLQEVGVGR